MGKDKVTLEIDPVIDPRAAAEIKRRLRDLEDREGVRILYACESGSRAWGFASTDSDYDVRFLYVRPPSWYLSINVEHRRDVVEMPIEDVWDINGWDLRKALRLLHKSNPSLLEWLQSPFVYREVTQAAYLLLESLPRYASAPAVFHHYLSMARRNRNEFLRNDTVRLKKYLYILRPLLACRWIEHGRGPVPVQFGRLVEAAGLSAEVRHALDDLLVRKRAGGELDMGSRIQALSDFIEAEFDRFESLRMAPPPPSPGLEPLNELFRQTLDGACKKTTAPYPTGEPLP